MSNQFVLVLPRTFRFSGFTVAGIRAGVTEIKLLFVTTYQRIWEGKGIYWKKWEAHHAPDVHGLRLTSVGARMATT